MNNLEFNKIFASLLIAGIIAMLCGFIAKQIVHPEKLDKDAVTIEVAEEAGTAGTSAPKGPEPILALLAGADLARGAQVAKACAACHTFDKGGRDGVGPHLWDVMNRKKDSVAGFAYSGELAKAGDPTWTYASLNKFLWKPKAYAPGTKMNYIGVKKPEDRAALIAYLRSLSDTPAALPSEGEIAAEAAALAPPAPATPAATEPTADSAEAKPAAEPAAH
jgi:cytochrome c